MTVRKIAPPSSAAASVVSACIATELLFAIGMRVSERANLLGKGNRQRRVFVPDEIKSLLRDYRKVRDRAACEAETFLVNCRGAAASPHMIRRLIRIHGKRSSVRDLISPTYLHSVATYLREEGVRQALPPTLSRPPQHQLHRDVHKSR